MQTIKLRIIVLTFYLAFSSLLCFSQQCDFSKHLEEVFTISYSSLFGKKIPQKANINNFRVQNCATRLAKSYYFVFYLHEHFSKSINLGWFSNPADSLKTHQEYISKLKEDKDFIQILNQWLEKAENPQKKDSVSLDEMLDIAVKFFSLGLDKNEKYTIKICVGINDILKTEPTRKPYLEAFCYASIFENHRGEEFNMIEEVKSRAKELYKINFGVEKQERMLRAQGALYILMKQSEKLQKMLLSDYEKYKSTLPFVLKI